MAKVKSLILLSSLFFLLTFTFCPNINLAGKSYVGRAEASPEIEQKEVIQKARELVIQGRKYLKLQEFAKAGNSFKKALEIVPDYREAERWLGRVNDYRAKAKQQKEKEEVLARERKKKAEDAARKRKEREEAAARRAEAAKLRPQNEPASRKNEKRS